jgi:hypothetical protein
VSTILCDGHQPHQTQMGNQVPPSGLPLLYPGSNLPAEVRSREQEEVIIDWYAAVAAATRQPAT